MRLTLNYLLIAVGVVLVSTSLFGALIDVRRALPGLLSSTGEQRGSGSLQEVKLRRGLLEKARVEPVFLARIDQGLAESPPQDGQRLPDEIIPATGLLPGAAKTAAEADGLPEGEVPSRIVIPAIGLDAPIVPAETVIVKVGGQDYQQWLPPNQRAAGWHEASALLGQPGNTVMNGHHNIYGEVFARLIDLEPGDILVVFGLRQAFVYQVTNKMLLREKYQALDVRMDNARWILPSEDERLTLVTCWPPETNTHRLIIVARPLGSDP